MSGKQITAGVMVGVMIALVSGAAGALTLTWASSRQNERDITRHELVIADHGTRIGNIENDVTGMRADITWIRKYLERRGGN